MRCGETMDGLLGQFPDLTMTIEATAAQADLVTVRVRTQGTNLGRLNGILPASGRHFTARQTHRFRRHEGRITEHWATHDDLTSKVQLGVVRRPRLAALVRHTASAVRYRLRRRTP